MRVRAEGVDLEDGGGPSHDLKVCGRHLGLCHIIATRSILA